MNTIAITDHVKRAARRAYNIAISQDMQGGSQNIDFAALATAIIAAYLYGPSEVPSPSKTEAVRSSLQGRSFPFVRTAPIPQQDCEPYKAACADMGWRLHNVWPAGPLTPARFHFHFRLHDTPGLPSVAIDAIVAASEAEAWRLLHDRVRPQPAPDAAEPTPAAVDPDRLQEVYLPGRVDADGTHDWKPHLLPVTSNVEEDAKMEKLILNAGTGKAHVAASMVPNPRRWLDHVEALPVDRGDAINEIAQHLCGIAANVKDEHARELLRGVLDLIERSYACR